MERKSQGACRGKWRYSDAAEYTGRAVYEISPAGEERTWDSAPSNSAAGEITCTPANRVCRLYKNSMVQVLCICRSPAAQAGRAQHEIPPPERSNPLNGENLIYQVRELRRNPLWSYAVPVGSRNFVPRPLAVGTADGGKEHEGCAASNSAAGENHLHPGKPSLPSFPDS